MSESSVQVGAIPAVPLTLEGWSILHQLFRVRWPAWKTLSPAKRKAVVKEATTALKKMEQGGDGSSAIYSMLGHKGDILALHFRRTMEGLNDAELQISNLKLSDYLEQTTSYLSVVELGLYQSSPSIYKVLAEKGLRPGTPDWKSAVETELAGQRKSFSSRLWPKIPPRRHVCFYPMGRKRGETYNWYQVSMEERRRMLHDHGMIGRRYAGQVTQIISESIGFDDWEWGVDLFADDPLIFKDLVYEMRFDEASAFYALFGPFYVGLRFSASELGELLSGKVPSFIK